MHVELGYSLIYTLYIYCYISIIVFTKLSLSQDNMSHLFFCFHFFITTITIKMRTRTRTTNTITTTPPAIPPIKAVLSLMDGGAEDVLFRHSGSSSEKISTGQELSISRRIPERVIPLVDKVQFCSWFKSSIAEFWVDCVSIPLNVTLCGDPVKQYNASSDSWSVEKPQRHCWSTPCVNVLSIPWSLSAVLTPLHCTQSAIPDNLTSNKKPLIRNDCRLL